MSEENNLVAMTIEVVASYVSHNSMPSADVAAFISQTHAAIAAISAPGAAAAEDSPSEAAQEYPPAVTVRKSLGSRDHILSLIDGKSYKSLKRHIGAHGLTPAQYRERYGLKGDYPMVAPGYSEKRREVAKRLGLGRKPKQPAAAPMAAVEPAVKATAVEQPKTKSARRTKSPTAPAAAPPAKSRRRKAAAAAPAKASSDAG